MDEDLKILNNPTLSVGEKIEQCYQFYVAQDRKKLESYFPQYLEEIKGLYTDKSHSSYSLQSFEVMFDRLKELHPEIEIPIIPKKKWYQFWKE